MGKPEESNLFIGATELMERKEVLEKALKQLQEDLLELDAEFRNLEEAREMLERLFPDLSSKVGQEEANDHAMNEYERIVMTLENRSKIFETMKNVVKKIQATLKEVINQLQEIGDNIKNGGSANA